MDLLVAGHLPVDVSVGDAIAAGQVSIEHLRDELGPFCLNADTIDCESLIRQFSTSHIYNTPTLVVLEAKGIPDYRSSSTLAVADDLPRSVDLYWRTSLEEHQARPVEYFAKREAVFEHEMTFVARLAAANAPILAGSDAGNPFIYPGESLHRELELLVNAGLSTQDALLAATLRPARFLGIADTVGAIRVGSVADIVLLEGNPLEDISNVRRVAAVVLRGRLLPKGMGD